MSSMLRLRNLRKSVDGRALLDIAEFDIPERTCIVLSGRNGAGKTTLLKIIAGLEEADDADVDYGGRTLSRRTAKARFRRDFVYLHQHPYMLNCSVSENVAYGLRRLGLSGTEITEKVEQALHWAGLSHLGTRNARRLSGGEKQRVALTRARVLSPKLLLLDEPVANMDLESREQTFFLINRLKNEGISTVVTSHDPYVAERLGDLHWHLCRTGPCRYTMVRPFLYRAAVATSVALDSAAVPRKQVITAANQDAEPARRPRDESPSERSLSRDTAPIPKQDITGVILAGGRAQRLGVEDKGLMRVNGRPMVEYVIDQLRPQVGRILINANHNAERYGEFGFPVVPDLSRGIFGPLVGMASALQATDTEYLLTVPCDSPLLPANLAQSLYLRLKQEKAEISVAHDGDRVQPLFALLRKELLPSLLDYLENGGRKIDTWYGQRRVAVTDFSDFPQAFLNVNTAPDRDALQRILRGEVR